MRKKFAGLQVIVSVGLLVFGACKLPRSSQGKVAGGKEIAPERANRCDQKVRYYSEKLRVGESSEEANILSEIVIDPIAKTINVASEPPNQAKVNFNIEIEGFDCSFNAGFTEGEATYKGYIKQTDGSTTSTHLKIEAKDGELTIAGNNPGEPVTLIMIVTKWEEIEK